MPNAHLFTRRIAAFARRGVILAVVAAATAGASDGFTLQPPSAMPSEQPVYWCPMHPDVRGRAGDKCPQCGMALVRAEASDYQAYLLDFEITPRVLRAHQKAHVRFYVRDPRTDVIVRRFELVHERVLHLFIVSQDLEYFAHVHPTLHRDGSLGVDMDLPRPGVYQMIADFLPVGGAPQLVQKSFVTAGYAGSLLPIAHLAPDTADKIAGDTRVKLTMPEPLAGRERPAPR